MKTKLVLLGIAAGLIAPLCAHADPESVGSGTPVKVRKSIKQPAVQTTASRHSDREVFYITNRTAVGSHIPLVVSRYHGEYASMSPSTAYGRNDLDRTGQLSVAGELLQREPSISSAGGVRR